MNLKSKIGLILFILIIIFYSFLSGFLETLGFLIGIIFYSNLSYLIVGIYRKIKNKTYLFFDRENIFSFYLKFLERFGIFFSIFIFVIGGFAFYQNDFSPAKMPVYTISNGEKTLVFQSMSHIGSENFYKNVRQNIINYKKNGYVLYFEGVKSGTQENNKKFNQAIGMTFDKNTYSQISKLYGLQNQKNEDFLGLVNNLDKNIDVSIDEIIKEYEKIKTQKKLVKNYSKPVEISNLVNEQLSKLNYRELQVLRYINKAFINMIIKNEEIQNTISSNFANKELFSVILDKRNEILANEILHSKDKKIIVTYGLLHFKGVYDILQKNDSKWQIKKIDYFYPIK